MRLAERRGQVYKRVQGYTGYVYYVVGGSERVWCRVSSSVQHEFKNRFFLGGRGVHTGHIQVLDYTSE